MMLRAILAGILLLTPLFAAAGADDAGESAWWQHTMMDRDHDGIDDALPTRGDRPITVLVDYASMPTASQRAGLAEAGFNVTLAPNNFAILAVRALPTQIPTLRNLPGVVFVEANDVIVRLLDKSVPLTGAPTVWESYGSTGNGVVVAVLDDGALEEHPDLQGKVTARYDAGTPPATQPVTSLLPLSTPVTPTDQEGHATHVAGTILGQGGQSGGKYRGVAPDASFVNVKVFTADAQTTSDVVIHGLDWTVSNMKRLNVHVASMSLGGRVSDGTDALSRAVDTAVEKGLIIVASAGNSGPDPRTITSPGAAKNAITVGAVDNTKTIASFSSRGPTLDGRTKPDIMAPGVGIWSSVPPANITQSALAGRPTVWYKPLSGTSMAAAHVSGVVALMLQVDPNLSPAQAKQMLLVTAQPLDEPTLQSNGTGYGFVNAIAAVQVVKDPSLLHRSEFISRLSTTQTPRAASGVSVWPIVAGILSIGAVGAGILIIRNRKR